MDTLKAEIVELHQVDDLKPMLASPGPCLSMYISLSSAPVNQSIKIDELEWKEVLRSVEPKIEELGAQGRELVDSLKDWAAVLPDGEPRGKGLAIFRSPDVFRIAWMDEPAATRAYVAPHFHIRPLLSDLTGDKTFYILALSQKNVRLLHCTTRSSEEVAFPSAVATSFHTYMDPVKPDHNSVNRSSAGPDSGQTKGVGGTTNTEREAKDQYLLHFFKQIDRGVNELLRNKEEHLVLAGVEYEVVLYRTVNSYPHIAEGTVHGAPNSLKSGEMHARAIEALQQGPAKKVDDALAQYNHRVGAGASNRLKEVLKASYDGRVLTLLISDSIEKTGAFDEETYSVKGRETGSSQDEDLVNDAAVQTIIHAGNVLVVPNDKMPEGTPVAAIFRY